MRNCCLSSSNRALGDVALMVNGLGGTSSTLSRLASEIGALLGTPAEITIRTFGDRSTLAS